MKNRFVIVIGLCFGLMNIVGASVTSLADVLSDEKIVVNASMAVVDSFAIMGECTQGQKARKEIEAKRDLATYDIQEESKKIEKARNEYVSKSTTMIEAAREKEEKKLLKMERDLKNMVTEKEEELKLDMQVATEKLAQELEEGVATLAKAEGIDIVFDKMTGRALYVSDKFDFTNKAIKAVNKNHEIKLAESKRLEKATTATRVAENKSTASAQSKKVSA